MAQSSFYCSTVWRWGTAIGLMLFCVACMAQSQQVAPTNQDESRGTITGTVVDPNGNFVSSAQVRLVLTGRGEELTVVSDMEGRFVFTGAPAGAFRVTIAAEGFASQIHQGILHPGETIELPPDSLVIAATTSEVRVSVSNDNLSEEQVKIEETQRVLGFIPNYFVTYRQDALPLRPRQKFELGWKTALDPVTFAASGAIAGIEQARNSYRGYGQGAQGYAKRYGASYGDAFFGIMIGSAILPSLLKQDPRYFYKGSGSTRSRTLYALANAVVCKGDNARWQVDYSAILGDLAAGGISNLYYPASSRNGAALTFENTLIGIGGSGIANLFQEFLVRRLTPHAQGKP